jgi:hypothetical protein
MLNRVVLGAFRISNKLETGFQSVASLKQGFLAKDGQIAFESLPPLYSLIVGGQAKPLLYTGTVSLPAWKKALTGVPSLQSELTSAHLSPKDAAAVREALALSNLSDDFAGPPGIPTAELDALRAAFVKAASSSALQAQAVKESLQVTATPGATLAKQVATALSGGSAIAPLVGNG